MRMGYTTVLTSIKTKLLYIYMMFCVRMVLALCLILGLFCIYGLRMNGTGVNDKKCMQFSAAVNMIIINSWRLLSLIIYLAYMNITARLCVVMRGYLSLKWFVDEF